MESHPTIPAPRVLAYNVGSGLEVQDDSVLTLLPSNLKKDEVFLAMTRVHGQTLDEVWSSLLEDDRLRIVHQIADLILDLASVTRNQIASLNADMRVVSPTELPRFISGRLELYGHEYWNIGPYDDVYSHAAATLSREILFHSGRTSDDNHKLHWINGSGMTKAQLTKAKENHIHRMQELCDAIKGQSSQRPLLPARFHAVHGDLAGRNLIISQQNTSTGPQPFISGILDFEWTNFYPVSEVMADSVLVTEVYDEEDRLECYKWAKMIEKLVIDKTRNRGWKDSDLTDIRRGAYYTRDSSKITSDLAGEESSEENNVTGEGPTSRSKSDFGNEGLKEDTLAPKLDPRKLAALASGAVDHDLSLAYYIDKS